MTNADYSRDIGGCEDLTRRLFEQIRAEFHYLSASVDVRPVSPSILSLTFNSQSRLPFQVVATLQSDELGLGIGDGFWCEWFPCTDNEVAGRFAQALRGVLSGEFQLVEYWRGERIIKAQLQQQYGTGWKTIASWSKARFPSWARATTRTSRNSPVPSD